MQMFLFKSFQKKNDVLFDHIQIFKNLPKLLGTMHYYKMKGETWN